MTNVACEDQCKSTNPYVSDQLLNTPVRSVAHIVVQTQEVDPERRSSVAIYFPAIRKGNPTFKGKP
ncbi:Hypothetical protein SMAX5B_000121 [Scophthalmus maximus]|uniref:Uncharacterized protein n=1 Tax=Scophthalmus maximus TaxID=52904 RepID=A0A2U9CXS1_SCOMX|nr:Hypothetical protein SMAX5B_000121 [Scophthalmus maximus]